MYRLSIDTGGTFTDLTAADDSGMIVKAKVPSSRNVDAFMTQALEALSRNVGLSATDFMRSVRLLVHGTTVPLNTLLQGRGSTVGLICTDGFRDALEIRQGYRESRYDFTYQTPRPLVPRFLRIPVRERIDRNGTVVMPLHAEDVAHAAEVFKEHKVRAIAVCLLWSFLNPNHERQIRDLLSEALPGLPVWLSSDVCPEIREYERTSTTVVNAYVAEAFGTHQDAFEGYLRSAGFGGEIRYLQSNGGLAGSDACRATPVAGIFSGPAAGPAAGLVFADLFGHCNAIVTDMGGTSFDACLVTGGVTEIRNVFTVGDHRVRSAAINVESIGAGGGSIARVDQGLLKVGPVSAGADPGPACYDKGGTEPTVTDANLLLGYINPDGLLGGSLKLHAELARQAIRRKVAKPLGISVERAALGIFEVVNQNMADALRDMTLGKGRDPRDYVFVAGGGAGPVHAGMLARIMSIRTVIVPRVAAELCAFGGLVCNLRHDYRRSCTSRVEDMDVNVLSRLFAEMERAGRQELSREGASADEIVITRIVDMRYKDQTTETPVDVTDLAIIEAAPQQILERFGKTYQEIYRYSQPGQPCEIINARVTVTAKSQRITFKPTEPASAPLAELRAGSRNIVLPESGQTVAAPVYRAEHLGLGHVVAGPAIIEEPDTAVVVFPGWRLELTPHPAYVMNDTSHD
jgi:N-methylhydantoinase A